MALAPTLGIANATSLVPNNFQYLKQWQWPQARLPFSHEFHIEFYSQFPCLRKMAFAAGGFFWSFVDGRVPIAILRLIVGRCFKLMIFLELRGGSFDSAPHCIFCSRYFASLFNCHPPLYSLTRIHGVCRSPGSPFFLRRSWMPILVSRQVLIFLSFCFFDLKFWEYIVFPLFSPEKNSCFARWAGQGKLECPTRACISNVRI